MEKKYLIIYNDTEVIMCSEYSEGVVVATTNSYIVETKENSTQMLSVLNIKTDKIRDYIDVQI